MACETARNKKSSLESDFEGKFILPLNRKARGIKREEFFLRQTVYGYQNNDNNKAYFLNGKDLGYL